MNVFYKVQDVTTSCVEGKPLVIKFFMNKSILHPTYRFGFQGQEKDDELKALHNSLLFNDDIIKDRRQ